MNFRFMNIGTIEGYFKEYLFWITTSCNFEPKTHFFVRIESQLICRDKLKSQKPGGSGEAEVSNNQCLRMFHKSYRSYQT